MYWTPWQLADDREAYGENAGLYILTSEDGEDEHPTGEIFPTRADAQRKADNYNDEEAHAAHERRYRDGGGESPSYLNAMRDAGRL